MSVTCLSCEDDLRVQYKNISELLYEFILWYILFHSDDISKSPDEIKAITEWYTAQYPDAITALLSKE